MSLISKLRHALLGRSQPKVQRLDAPDSQGARIDELPPFSLKTADLMRYDPQVRIGLGARNGLLMAAEVEVHGDDRRLTTWAQQQWNSLWHSAAHQLLRAKLYGFLPFEVVYRRASTGPHRGLLQVDRLIDHHPKHTRLLVQGDKIVGFSTDNTAKVLVPGGSQQETSDIFAPRALVCTFDAECGNPYGCALLARAYPAWYEKWMPGGAKRTLRLRMIKDAYIGDIDWSLMPPIIPVKFHVL